MTFSELYETADVDTRQWLDERAAIREYDGNVTRREAESATARDWLKTSRERAATAGHDAESVLQSNAPALPGLSADPIGGGHPKADQTAT